jgi:hypothetical protein
MMKTNSASRIIAISLLALVAAAIVVIKISAGNGSMSKASQQIPNIENRLVVHEWGTFTSITGQDGVALEWRPLNGPSDLPKFVHTIQKELDGLRHGRVTGKADLTALVRMETPILYFYSANETDVSVKVDFPKGKITEWYPQARTVDTTIDWGRLKVMPGAAVSLPVDYSNSHYFAARETDSAPIQVCRTDGRPAQQEKFLFYRGVGTFDLPLSVKLDNGNVTVKNLGKDEITHLVIFENRGGRIGYRLIDSFAGETTSPRPPLDKNTDSLIQDLKQVLVSSGLYEKEAEAMIKTWRDSWFEEGARVFYILPRQTTDTVLPITIEPRPTELVRVLVGRAEVITPEMEKAVQQKVSLLRDPSAEVRQTAMSNIRKYGRFSEPILKRILANEKDSTIRERIKRLIEKTVERAE